MFSFKGVVDRFSKGVVEVMTIKEGYYDINQGAKWIDGNEEVRELFPAAIVVLSQNDLKFDEGGSYDFDDRKLYCYERLDKSAKVINTMADGTKKTYSILSDKDYSDFEEGLHIYILKRSDRLDSEN